MAPKSIVGETVLLCWTLFSIVLLFTIIGFMFVFNNVEYTNILIWSMFIDEANIAVCIYIIYRLGKGKDNGKK